MVGGVALVCGFFSGAWAADTSITFSGHSFVNKGLIAVGRLPSNLRDKFGETLGSGSAMAVEPESWRRIGEAYEGSFLLLPDRGYNAAGTTEYRPRVNRIILRVTPGTGIAAAVTDTIMLTDAMGAPLTGLDPEVDGLRKAAGGFPDLPQGMNGRIALDSEGIVPLADGTFFISDEYGPFIYRFSGEGKMLSAIQPPEAFLPMRKGSVHFGSNNPGLGAKAPVPPNPDTGRQNNQGFEGLTLTPDGKKLIALLQSATRQDGGDATETRHNTRALVYDISNPAQPLLRAEYVVPLPRFMNASGATLVAAQSELLALSDTIFLMIARDSGNGYGQKSAKSLFRSIELVDIGQATNIAGSAFDSAKPVAPKGVSDASIKPADVRSFIDINDAAELSKFGLHNGEPNDRNNLSEKWEGLTLVSALDSAHPRDFFLLVVNDNDFLTTDGFQVGAPYKSENGADVDTMFLAYRVTIPALAR